MTFDELTKALGIDDHSPYPKAIIPFLKTEKMSFAPLI